jgi:hypothetical protein
LGKVFTMSPNGCPRCLAREGENIAGSELGHGAQPRITCDKLAAQIFPRTAARQWGNCTKQRTKHYCSVTYRIAATKSSQVHSYPLALFSNLRFSKQNY